MEQNLTPSERVFADQATNPASSRDRSWEKDVEYFKRYAILILTRFITRKKKSTLHMKSH